MQRETIARLLAVVEGSRNRPLSARTKEAVKMALRELLEIKVIEMIESYDCASTRRETWTGARV